MSANEQNANDVPMSEDVDDDGEDEADEDEDEAENTWNEELFRLIESRRGTCRDIPEEIILNDIIACTREGADIHRQNEDGDTLLHVAVAKGYWKIVGYLLSESSNWDRYVNRRKMTAYDLAKDKAVAMDIFRKYRSNDVVNAAKRCADDITIDEEDDGNESVKRNKLDLPKTYKSGGLKQSLHGVVYQLKLHMLILKRALAKGYTFHLAAEMDDAEKFDDLVFVYWRDRIEYRFLQAKHKQNESTKIASRDLLTENSDREFGLPKYFASYRKIMQSDKLNFCDASFVLCTNITFDADELARAGIELLLVDDADELLDVESERKAEKYKIDAANSARKEEIYELLRNTSDLYVLGKELRGHFVEQRKLTLRTPVFGRYHRALISDGVLDLSSDNKGKSYVTFNGDFLAGRGLSGNLALLRDIIFDGKTNKKWQLPVSPSFGQTFELDADPQITDCRELATKLCAIIGDASADVVPIKRETTAGGIVKDNLSKLAGHVLIKRDDDDDDFVINADFVGSDNLPGNLSAFRDELRNATNLNDLLEYKFKIANYRTCSKDRVHANFLPNDPVADAEIEAFFASFAFAVDQPNEIELEATIKRELGDDVNFNLLNADLVSDTFQKEMLDWFKEKGRRKGEEGRFLSNDDARDLFAGIDAKINTIVGVGLSLNYPKYLDSFDVKFRTLNETVRDFLRPAAGNDRFLIVRCENVLLSALKINQTLTAMGQPFAKRDSFMFTTVDVVLRLKRYVTKAFASDRSHDVLIVSCETGDRSTIGELFDELRYVIAGNGRKRLIMLIPQIEWIASTPNDDRYDCDEIADETMERLAGKKVSFQGEDVTMGEIVGNLKDVLDVDTVIKLIASDDDADARERMRIGRRLDGLKEVGEYYVERRFARGPSLTLDALTKIDGAVIILSGIANERMDFGAKEVRSYETAIERGVGHVEMFVTIGDADFAAKNEKYEQLLRVIAQEVNVHWFDYDTSTRAFVLQRGRSVDDERFVNRTLNESEMLSQNGLVTLSNAAGMGKSTSTICLSGKLKRAHPHVWTIRVSLNQCTDALDEETYLRTKKKRPRFTATDGRSLANFLTTCLAPREFNTAFERRLFEHLLLREEEERRVAIYLDGFDEISPDYESVAIDLIRALIDCTRIKLLFVTTRPTCERSLADRCGSFAYNLLTLTLEEQIDFVERKWWNKLRLLARRSRKKRALVAIMMGERRKRRRLVRELAEALMSHIAAAINDRDTKLSGIPLTASMIADVYFEKFLVCYQTGAGGWDLAGDRFDVVALYAKFVRNKFLIYNSDKKREKRSNLSVRYDNDHLYEIFLTRHRHAALYAMLKRSELCSLLSERQRAEMLEFVDAIENGIERSGIITQIVDGRPCFLHVTFMEFFAASFLVDQLQRNWRDEELLLIKVLVQPEYEVMRFFFNGLLQKDATIEANIANMWDNKICTRLNDRGENLLHVACKEGNDGVVEFLLTVIKESTTSKLINERIAEGNTCLIVATMADNLEMARRLLEHGADPNVKNYRGFVPLHVSAERNRQQMTALLLSFGANAYVGDENDRQPIHYAAKYGHLEVVEMLAKRKDLYEVDNERMRAIDLAAHYERWHVVEWLLENVRYNNKHVTISSRSNVFISAAKCGRIDLMRRLLDIDRDFYFEHVAVASREACGNGQLDSLIYLTSLYEPTRKENETYLTIASNNRHETIIEHLMALGVRLPFADKWPNCSDEVYHSLISDDRLDLLKMLLRDEEDFEAIDDNHMTIAVYVAELDKWDIFNWLVSEKSINVNLPNYYLEMTLLHYAVEARNLEAIRILLEKGAQLLPAKNGLTPLDNAKEGSDTEVVEMLEKHFDINRSIQIADSASGF